MNQKTRLFCLLLALVLTVSALPMRSLADTTETTTSQETTAAAEPPETTAATEEAKPATGTATVKVVVGKTTLYTYTVEVGDKPVKLSDQKYIKHKNKYYEFSYYTVNGAKPSGGRVTIDAYDEANDAAWKAKWGSTIKVIYKSHSHKYRFGYGRIYHWNICACGATTKEVRHVDPAKDADKICTCGYKFNDNANLTTLWLKNMVLSPRFNPETTEYIGELHTYKDVTSTSIAATPFDALAKVTLPENLEIHEGANKFVITVTAEDTVATKTYTVIAVKPVKVENTHIGSDGTNLTAKLVTKVSKKVAAVQVSETVEAKLLELALQDKSSTITMLPQFSKWSVKHTDVTLSADFIKNVAEKTEAALAVQTPYGSTLTLPHEEVVELAKGSSSVTLRVAKDGTFQVLTIGEPITASQRITLTTPAKK